MEQKKLLVPDYFEQFHCKCGDCRQPCCDGWGISVKKQEYFSLLGIACSPRLRGKLDSAFMPEELPTDEAFASIRPNYLEQCPMLDEDGLCLLQKEKGEKMLPVVCRVYPRAIKDYGGHHEISMSCSCEETVELLMQSTAPLTLHEAEATLPFDGIPVYPADDQKDKIRHTAIFLLSDHEKTLSERLLAVASLGGLTLSRPTLSRGEAIQSFIPILSILSRHSKSIRAGAEAAIAYLGGAEDNPNECLRRFDAAEGRLHALIPHAEIFAARLIANHILYESFPFVPGCPSADTALAALVMAIGALKMICVCAMAKESELSAFVDLFASANRFIEHSDYYANFGRLFRKDAAEALAMVLPILENVECINKGASL